VIFKQTQVQNQHDSLIEKYKQKEIQEILNYTKEIAQGFTPNYEIGFSEKIIIEEFKEIEDSIEIKIAVISSYSSDTTNVYDISGNLISTRIPFEQNINATQLKRPKIINTITGETY